VLNIAIEHKPKSGNFYAVIGKLHQSTAILSSHLCWIT